MVQTDDERNSKYTPIENANNIIIQDRTKTNLQNIEVISYFYKEQEAEDPINLSYCIYNNKTYLSSALDEKGLQEFIEENNITPKNEKEALEIATLIYKHNNHTILTPTSVQNYNLGTFDKNKIKEPTVKKVNNNYLIQFYVLYENPITMYHGQRHEHAFFCQVEIGTNIFKIKKETIYSTLNSE